MHYAGLDGRQRSTAIFRYVNNEYKLHANTPPLIDIDGNEIPVSFINMHPKAMGDERSYNMRKASSIGLKTLLDSPEYSSKKLVIIGDFNDYLIGTQCSSCGGVSPYQNFVNDTENYKGLTTKLYDPYYSSPVIDNIIISDELFGNYVNKSAIREVAAAELINNYRQTTSDHTPVSVILRLADAGCAEIDTNATIIALCDSISRQNDTISLLMQLLAECEAQSSVTNPDTELYGRPLQAWISNGVLNISGLNAGETFRIYSISGTLVYQSVATSNPIETWNATSIQHGTYIIQQGRRAIKIVW